MRPNAAQLYTLPLRHFKGYLELENWRLVSESDRWVVFEDKGAIELALPKMRRASDYQMYIDQFLNTLSFAQDQEPEAVADDILSYDRDVLTVILDKSARAKSISVSRADACIHELRQLILYAASSEQRAKRSFNTVSMKAREALDHFEFGYTASGSFGLRIESKLVAESRKQHQMFAGDPQPVTPRARKVLTRIYKGLAAAERTICTGDLSHLVDGYASGLNANMCAAILNMAGDARDPVEYRFNWSRTVPAPKQLADCPAITIGTPHLDALERASEQLYKQDADYVDVIGVVTDLSHRDTPDDKELGDGAITIQRHLPSGQDRSQQIHAVVGSKDHLTAVAAYREQRTVGLRGLLEYSHSKWRLKNPENLRILD